MSWLGAWLGVAVVLAALVEPATAAGSLSALRFTRSGGTKASFKLLQLTDIHFGEGSAKDDLTLEVMRTVLAAEQPDLVVLSGDMVSGYAFPAGDLAGRIARLADRGGRTSTWFERQWRQLIAPLLEAGVPYAAILGNHDAEADLGRRGIVELISNGAVGGNLSLTRRGPAELAGAGNYWLDIYGPEGDPSEAEVAARIWLLDSGNRGCGCLAYGWGCIHADTVAWVRQQAERLPRVPSVAFVHIPLPQHLAAWNHGSGASGSKGDPVGCPALDTGFFSVARELGIHAVYSGHDHSNDWSAALQGVRLAYGRKTGYGSYEPNGLLHGARVVELQMDEDTAGSDTWIRQEDGSKLVQPEVQAPRLLQQTCNLGENQCIKLLGAALCTKLQAARNTATLVAVLCTLAAVAAATCLAVAALVRHSRQHWRGQRSWQRLDSSEKPGESAFAVSVQ